jgi:hypothetical protein
MEFKELTALPESNIASNAMDLCPARLNSVVQTSAIAIDARHMDRDFVKGKLITIQKKHAHYLNGKGLEIISCIM